MTEFVEERFDFPEGHQRWLVADGRCAVADKVRDGKLHVATDQFSPEAVVHPGAAAFVLRPRVRVEIEGCNAGAVAVEHFEVTNIFVPDRSVF